MKKFYLFFLLVILVSCTSNTILEKPKDLIPKDSMSLLIQEMSIASSAKYVKNNFQETDVNYMALVFERFQIDSTRFQKSNLYYMSKVDDYHKILENAAKNLEIRKNIYSKIKAKKDSIRKDSMRKKQIKLKKLDSIRSLHQDKSIL